MNHPFYCEPPSGAVRRPGPFVLAGADDRLWIRRELGSTVEDMTRHLTQQQERERGETAAREHAATPLKRRRGSGRLRHEHFTTNGRAVDITEDDLGIVELYLS